MAIELSGSDRALHEAIRSVVVDGHGGGRPASTRAARRTCASARSSTTTGSGSSRARSAAPPSALGPRWDQRRLVRTFMAQVRPRAGRRRPLVTDVVDAADVAAVFARLDAGDPAILQAVLRFPAAPDRSAAR